MEQRNKTVFTNFIWRFLERCGAQGVTFIVSIIVSPENWTIWEGEIKWTGSFLRRESKEA